LLARARGDILGFTVFNQRSDKGLMKIIKLDELEKDPGRYGEVAEVLKEDGIVIIPGESNYRLGVNALSPQAVSRLQQAKRRVQNKPALVFIHDKAELKGLVGEIPDVARQLMATFWPGPLTIRFEPGQALPAKVRKALTKATGRIGVRIPGEEICAEVARSFGAPMLVSSANRSKKAGAQSLAQVRKNFGNVADLLIDAGDLPKGNASTVVDVSANGWTMIREGALTTAEISEKIGVEPG
jgi:L-threonylcarbamoyladenylate synthase